MNKQDNHKNNKISSNSVMNYLNNKLTPEETHDLEAQFADDPLLVDAIEGLRLVDNSAVPVIDQKLKQFIHKKVALSHKTTSQFGFPNWLVVTIILLLLLISVGYLIIVKLIDH
jgi:hypothetical protein